MLKAVSVSEENHLVVNGYANLWDFKNDQKQYAIVFLPQIFADIGLKITLIFTGTLTFILGIFYIKKLLK